MKKLRLYSNLALLVSSLCRSITFFKESRVAEELLPVCAPRNNIIEARNYFGLKFAKSNLHTGLHTLLTRLFFCFRFFDLCLRLFDSKLPPRSVKLYDWQIPLPQATPRFFLKASTECLQNITPDISSRRLIE